MIDRFEGLLKELSAELGVTLHPDRRGACRLKINEQFHVQLECDAGHENVLVATFIGELPPGKFRENILKDALQANSPFPKNGILSYSERNNQLALFERLPLSNLNGNTLANFLAAFIEKATQWKNGIETGHTDHLVERQNKQMNRPFGLR